jgi:VCBS repeat protein
MVHLHWQLFREKMRRRGFPITGAIIFAADVVLRLAAFGSDASSPRRNPNLSEFTANVGKHVTPADPGSVADLQRWKEIPAQTEGGPLQIPSPTRSSFMASWQNVSGAIGYRLDVSTNSAFTSYVNGYQDLDVGNVTGQVVTGLSQGTTYYYRVHAYDSTGTTSGDSTTTTATTSASIGLIINPTFDGSITSNPNAAAIEAMVQRAILIYESLFSDPITIKILFRYSTTAPNGTPLGSGWLSRSDYVVYEVPWETYLQALVTDAITGYDFTANTSLPTTTVSANIVPSSANGRAVKLNTSPAMFANGTVASGGPYDGIVTLNSTAPFQFNRPTSSGNFDAQRQTEHEIDEVLGLGSRLGTSGSDLRPQDLFSWSSAGVRNLTSSGTRYFSINRGSSRIVYFNQNSTADFGDWLSTSCPQANPFVQNAFACQGQYSDVTLASPEAINLDVIGYNLINSPSPAPTDFNNDGKPDLVLYNSSTRQTVIWNLKNNVVVGSSSGPSLSPGYNLVGVADFNRDGHSDYLIFNPITGKTVIWYLKSNVLVGAASGPTFLSGNEVVATSNFVAPCFDCGKDGWPDLVLYNSSTRQTVVVFLLNNKAFTDASGPSLPAGYSLVGLADFNRDGNPDYLLFNPTTRQSQIWYLSGATLLSTQSGPTIPSGYKLVGTADFNGDGHPDYLLFNPSTGQTVIWYMKNNVIVGAAAVSTVPSGWTVVAP